MYWREKFHLQALEKEAGLCRGPPDSGPALGAEDSLQEAASMELVGYSGKERCTLWSSVSPLLPI